MSKANKAELLKVNGIKKEFMGKSEEYLEEHKIPDLFSLLSKRLLINLPENPMEYLIKELENFRNIFLCFIVGYPESKCSDIAESVASKFGMKHIKITEKSKNTVVK